MTTFLLVLLLVGSLVGAGLLGYHAFRLHATIIRLTAESDGQKTRYEQDARQWHERGESLKARCQAAVEQYHGEAKKWKAHAAELKADNDQLAQWRGVADAENKATEMVKAAEARLLSAKTEAESLVATAQQQADALTSNAREEAESLQSGAHATAESVTSEAKEKARVLKNEAQGILDSATAQAATIIDAARKKADEIAGSAYEAMQNVSQYEQTAKALRNLIDGYGDEYIVPQQSLLDDLADDFSHTKAGLELKRAREATKVMVRNRTAATCGYVETNRRDTAINFVVDAFNGKVDSILSRVKHDNAGKLQPQVRDAFALVNYNGKAFRDAQITEEFLSARLEELKWAAVVQQLALEEREEQRRIKEQLREEARAEKERERALRESAKEEELLRAGMEQAREQYEHASGEQKAMYEKRLAEMAEKLKESEERKQRARSMAEQTRKGYVYVISNVGSFGEDVYKIGLTRRWDPQDRVRELGDSSVPFEFDVHAMILSDDAPALEQRLHDHFRLRQVNKVNHRKEFFRVSLQDIREELERLGITTGIHWTMTAAAREYRESQAIETAIRERPAERDAWLKRQGRLEAHAGELVKVADGNGEEEEE